MPEFTEEQWAALEKQQTEAAAVETPEQKATREKAEATAAPPELVKTKADLEAASKRLAEVEAELAKAKLQPLAVAPLHPLFTADAGQLDATEAQCAAVKEWALAHWDGSAAVDAAGDQPAQPAYTAEQVRAAFARADKQLTTVIPAARQALGSFIAQSVQAKAVYPEMFEANNPHAQNADLILRRLPGLKAALPNVHAIIGDASVGEVIRLMVHAEKPTAEAVSLAQALIKAMPQLVKFMPQLANVGKTAGKTAGKPGFKLPAKPIVPLARPAPAGGSSFRRPGGAARPGPTVKTFRAQLSENGGDQVAALAKTLAGTE